MRIKAKTRENGHRFVLCWHVFYTFINNHKQQRMYNRRFIIHSVNKLTSDTYLTPGYIRFSWLSCHKRPMCGHPLRTNSPSAPMKTENKVERKNEAVAYLRTALSGVSPAPVARPGCLVSRRWGYCSRPAVSRSVRLSPVVLALQRETRTYA